MFTHSRSAFAVTLEIEEVEALIDWHSDAKEGAALLEEYALADGHVRRLEDLAVQLTTRRNQLRTEALALTRMNLAVSNGERA